MITSMNSKRLEKLGSMSDCFRVLNNHTYHTRLCAVCNFNPAAIISIKNVL